ncbi:MAG TPA: ABC transporter permease [Acidobacteriaceae bacterium]|jgi:ABC-2 type transport system permease protein
MHNTWLIAKREYLERVRTKGFLLATVLIPCAMGALLFGTSYFMMQTKTTSHIAVVTTDNRLGEALQQRLKNGKHTDMQVDLYQPSDETRATLNSQLHTSKSKIAGYLWIKPPATSGERPVFEYHARSAGDLSTEEAIENVVNIVVSREGLLGRGLSAADVDRITAPVDIDTSSNGNTQVAFAVAYFFFILMYMVIMLYGMNTARSIIEEKGSRVFEVLLATITPDELLAGKILGVGAVGLTQIGIWMAAALAISSTQYASSLMGGGHGPVSLLQAAYFLAYFLFGFILYSSIAAALGAMTNSEQELQQLNMFLVMPLAFCMLMLFQVVRAPDSTLARVVSLIPFCSPLLMNLRTSLTYVAPWEIILSFVLMGLTIVAIVWVSSRIYRVGILMYGKKPNLPEILRWLKYS